MFFKKKYKISQNFGENPQTYKQFGMQGHNGIDYATPVGTPIILPFDIYSIRHENSKKGYGMHIKAKTNILDNVYQVVFGHLSIFKSGIKKGEIVGETGDTGFSTGPHLHFGVRKLDNDGMVEDYNNGFFGYFDPVLFFDIIESTKISKYENKVIKDFLLNNSLQWDFLEDLKKKGIDCQNLQKKLEEINKKYRTFL